MVGGDRDLGPLSLSKTGEDALSTLHANLPGAAYQCEVSAPWSMSYISPGVLDLTGYRPEAFINEQLSWGAITHPDDLARLRVIVETAVAARQPFSASYRIRCATGQEKWVEERGEAVWGAAGEPLSLVGFINDVSHQKRADERRLEAENHYKWALQLSEHLSWTTDPAGKAIEMSQELLERLGVPLEQAQSAGWSTALHPDDAAATLEDWSRAFQNETPIDQRFRLQQKDGDFRWYRARGAPIRGTDGAILKWHGTIEDITNQVEAEKSITLLQAKLSHHSQDSGMVLMAGTLAHELNQPLAAAVNYVEASAALVEAPGAINVERLKKGLVQAQDQIFRASDIINRARNLVKGQQPAADVISVRELLYRSREIAVMSGACPEFSFQSSISRLATKVLGDQVQLEQVVLNLYRNACSAMAHMQTPEIKVGADVFRQGFAKITVTDAGTGIPDEAQSSLFTAYTHSSTGGLGVGLAISRTIVEAHGGQIWAERNRNLGMSFMFTVPLAEHPLD